MWRRHFKRNRIRKRHFWICVTFWASGILRHYMQDHLLLNYEVVYPSSPVLCLSWIMSEFLFCLRFEEEYTDFFNGWRKKKKKKKLKWKSNNFTRSCSPLVMELYNKLQSMANQYLLLWLNQRCSALCAWIVTWMDENNGPVKGLVSIVVLTWNRIWRP